MPQIVIIGAGSLQFGCRILGDFFQSRALAGSHIVLHDISALTLRATLETGRRFIEHHHLDFQLAATTDRSEALRQAEFVILAVEAGDRFALWEQDWKIPLQYGLSQIYGENAGPGGLFHSLRVIPEILSICDDIAAICPEAFIFNYSNPLSRICSTVAATHPELRFYGMCHEITSVERYLPRLLERDLSELTIRAGGLNHCSCIIEAVERRSGADLYPEILVRAKEFFATVPGGAEYLAAALEESKATGVLNRPLDHATVSAGRDWSERKLFQFVLEHFDLLPITTDSHLGEYLPWAADVADHQGILTFYRHYRNYLRSVLPTIQLRQRERAVSVIEALLGYADYEEPAINLPNHGFIRELPSSIAVEVPARIRKGSIEGIELPPFPPALAGLLQNQVGVHQMTTEAVRTRSKNAVVQALLVDPTVHRARCLPELVEVMIELQREYLGYLR